MIGDSLGIIPIAVLDEELDAFFDETHFLAIDICEPLVRMKGCHSKRQLLWGRHDHHAFVIVVACFVAATGDLWRLICAALLVKIIDLIAQGILDLLQIIGIDVLDEICEFCRGECVGKKRDLDELDMARSFCDTDIVNLHKDVLGDLNWLVFVSEDDAPIIDQIEYWDILKFRDIFDECVDDAI